MFDLEKVELLREKTSVSYEEAKAVLTETDGDLLDAFVLLEQRGRIPLTEPKLSYGTSTNSESYTPEEPIKIYGGPSSRSKNPQDDQFSFGELLGRFFAFMRRLIHRGNRNSLHVTRAGEEMVSIPLTLLVILLLCAFWIVFPLLIIGLFCGYRYQFSGPDLGKDSFNNTMDNVSDATRKAVYNVKEAASDFSKDVKKGTGEATHDESTSRGHSPSDDVDSSN